MRQRSKVVPINSVKRKVIKHDALSTPKEEVTQRLHCRSRLNRIDFFLSPLTSSRTFHSDTPSSNKPPAIVRQRRSPGPRSGRVGD